MSLSFSLTKLDGTDASGPEDGIAVYDITVSPAHVSLQVVQGEAEVIGSGSLRRVTFPSNGVVQLEATCGGYEPETRWLRPSTDENRSFQLSLAEAEKKEPNVTIVHPTVVPPQGSENAPPPAPKVTVHQPVPVVPPVVRELPSSLQDVVAGKGGRCLILHMPGELAMYDVISATIVDKLAVPADAMVVAGLDTMIVASPSQRTIWYYDIERLARGAIKSAPITGVVKAMALGYASQGPLLVLWAPDARETTRAYCTLFGVTTLGPIRIDAVVKQHYGTPKTMTKPVARGTLELQQISHDDIVHLRASGSGQVFGLWCTSNVPSGLETLILDGRWALNYYEQESVGHVVPSANGAAICTASGCYRADLTGKRDDRACIPSYHPDYYMTIPISTPGGKSRRSERLAVVRSTESGKPILELPKLEEVASLTTDPWAKHDLTLDKRFHLFPEAGLLITIPVDNDKLVLRQIDLGITREVVPITDQEAEAGPVESEPNRKSRDRKPREWTDTSGKFRVTATFVSLSAGRVKLRKADGQVITVELGKLSEADVAYIEDIGG